MALPYIYFSMVCLNIYMMCLTEIYTLCELENKTWMKGVRAAMETRHLEADQWLNRKEWCLGSGRRRQLSQDRKER
jgi:hypothetical protein